jgi:hypothetical protein
MAKAYILKGTENEYLLVVRAEDEKMLYKIIDALSASRVDYVKDLAVELEKSLSDSRRDTSETRSKNKSKSPTGNNSGRRKTKNP